MTSNRFLLAFVTVILIAFLIPITFAADKVITLGVVPHMYGDPDCDQTEKNIFCYMGQQSEVTHIITPSTKQEFVNKLKKFEQHGFTVKKMLIAGHGSADFPRIEFGNEYLGFKDLDKKGVNNDLNMYKKIQIKNETLLVKDPGNIHVKTNLLSINKKIEELNKKITFIDSIPSIMDKNGEVLLINCSTAARPEGIKFVKTLGASLFGNKKGNISASTVDVTVDQAKSYFQTFFAPGGTSVGEFFIKGNWITIPINNALKASLKRDINIRLFEIVEGVPTSNLINNGVIHLTQGNIKKAAKQKNNGDYKFSDAEPGNYTLTVQAKGYKTRSGSSTLSMSIIIPAIKQGMEKQPIYKTLYLEPATQQVTIEVVDDQGKAVPAASVALSGKKWRSGKLRPVDNLGKIVFKDSIPGNYKVFAGAPGYESQTGQTKIKIDPLAEKNGSASRLVLTPLLSTVQITVKDAFSEPVKNVQVRLGENKSGFTNDQGLVIFNAVRPSGGLEPYKVLAKKDGYTPASTPIEVSPTQQNEMFTVEVTLKGGVPLTVKVIETNSGKALEGATVQLFYADEYKSEISDQRGEVRFDSIAPALIYISATLPGFQAVSNIQKDLRNAEAGKEQLATITLTEGMKITVYLKDHEGELLSSGYISMDDGPFFEAPTGSREFTPVKEGRHMFRGRAKKFAEAAIFYKATPKQKSREKVSLKLLPGATIMVEVRNDRGELLREKATSITLLKNGRSLKTATGPLKLFANLEPGTYSARANAKEYISSVSRSVDYSGYPPAYHGTLQVTLTPKMPLSTIFVSVIAKDDQGKPSNGPANIKVTGPAGSFSAQDLIGKFSDLVPGKYTVTASLNGFSSKTKTVTILPEQLAKTYTLSFNLSPKQETPNNTNKQNSDIGSFNYSSCLDACNLTDDCISSCLLKLLNYCRDVCRKQKSGPNCEINCRNNNSATERSEPVPEFEYWNQNSVRTIPGSDNSDSRQ